MPSYFDFMNMDLFLYKLLLDTEKINNDNTTKDLNCFVNLVQMYNKNKIKKV